VPFRSRVVCCASVLLYHYLGAFPDCPGAGFKFFPSPTTIKFSQSFENPVGSPSAFAVGHWHIAWRNFVWLSVYPLPLAASVPVCFFLDLLGQKPDFALPTMKSAGKGAG